MYKRFIHVKNDQFLLRFWVPWRGQVYYQILNFFWVDESDVVFDELEGLDGLHKMLLM